MPNHKMLDIKYTKRALKSLQKVRKSDKRLYEKVTAAIEEIRINPFVGEPKQGDLEGYSCYDIHHMRTNYELCYRQEDDENGNLILIVMFGTRENFYEELKRYLL